jgi:DNA-binding HxlR family transcriptional regulator
LDCCKAISGQVTLQFIGGKWQMGILNALKNGPAPFVEINKHLLGLSEKVLTQEREQKLNKEMLITPISIIQEIGLANQTV